MDQFDKQKEKRRIMNARMCLMVGGLFLAFTAVTSTIMYGINFFMISMEAAKGTEKYVEALETAGLSIAMLRGMGISFVILGAIEIVCGVFGARFSNRVDKSGFTLKMLIGLLVVELLMEVFLFFTHLMNLGMLFNAVVIPVVMVWGAVRLRRLAKAEPERVYAVEIRKNNVRSARQAKPGSAPGKSLRARAAMTERLKNEETGQEAGEREGDS